jgi:hypothetical protein
VVEAGDADLEVWPVTVMLPGFSLKLVAPVTDHDKVEDCVFVIELGVAVNEVIAGRPGPGVGVGTGVGVGVGEPFTVVNVRSPDVDGLPASSFDFTL